MDRVERSGRRIAGEGGFAHRRQSRRRRATKAGPARGGADADCRSAPQRCAGGRARLVPGTGLEPASQLRRRIFVTLLLSKPAPRGAVRALDYAFAVVRTRFDRVNLRRPRLVSTPFPPQPPRLSRDLARRCLGASRARGFAEFEGFCTGRFRPGTQSFKSAMFTNFITPARAERILPPVGPSNALSPAAAARRVRAPDARWRSRRAVGTDAGWRSSPRLAYASTMRPARGATRGRAPGPSLPLRPNTVCDGRPRPCRHVCLPD